MDRPTRERLKRRRKRFIRFLIFVLLSMLVLWGIRPETLFNRPQQIFDSSWWLDVWGHLFIFFVIGLLAIYESRLVLQSAFNRWITVFLKCLGWGALFEIGEFYFDLLRPYYFPWLDSAQKGNADTMYDLIADVGGILIAILFWMVTKSIYNWLFPSDGRVEYLAERSELIIHYKAEAKRLEKEYRRDLAKNLISIGKNEKKPV